MRIPPLTAMTAAGIFLLALAPGLSGKAQAPAPAVIVDAASPTAPMSKYIYGQFIEHLGRCIYGGIWAEMLEDRKFFHPVAEGESPWTMLGEPRSTAMTTTTAFVGEHSPEFELDGTSGPSGISQAGLGVVAGARYTGRVLLAGNSAAGPIEVSLVWGPGPSGRQTVTIRSFDDRYRPYPIAFTAGAASDDARLEIAGRGKGRFRIGTVSLMPANNVEGFRPDVLALLRELNAPVYRWPGGNFVSGYNWRDGIGDRDRRPPRKNPAWKGVEHNDVGIHEFMALCRLIGAEPYIAVNSGLGDAASAAAQVEYVNGAASTPMGAQRALNGQQAPFKVRWWSIGNEMYGDWQLGHMPLGDYVKKHAVFADAMRAKDPGIEIVAVGDVGAWDEAMLAGNAGNMALISEHFYVQEAPDLPGHVAQVPRHIKRIADAHRRYRRDDSGAGREEHPHRARRVELLVRAASLRRARDAVLPQRRAWHRGRHPRILAPGRRHLHGQLRADGERDWRDQDHEDRRRLRHDGPRAEAVPSAFRPGAGHDHRRARAIGCRGGMARRQVGPHPRHRQSDLRTAGARAAVEGRVIRGDGHAEADRRDGPEGVQRAGQAGGGEDRGDLKRARRRETHPAADEHLDLRVARLSEIARLRPRGRGRSRAPGRAGARPVAGGDRG